MPAVSAPQQHLMGMALAYKRGDLHGASPEVRRVAGGMSERQLRDFAATKGLASGGNAGGIGHPEAYHLMPSHGIGAAHPHLMSASEGSPWWTRSSARMEEQPMRHGFAEGGGIGLAQGGVMPASEGSPWWERSEARIADVPFHSGLIGGTGAGRTDRLPLSVESDSHIVPSDVVSAIGQGGTDFGAKALQAALATAPWGVALPKMVHGHGPPAAPHVPAGMTGMATGGQARTSILAASSEVVVPPRDVMALGERGIAAGMCKKGEGAMDCGHRLIDEMILRIRKDQIEWLKHAPPPKK